MSSLGAKTEELSVLLDISSGSVGGALVLRRKKAVPLILHTTRVDFSTRPELTEARLRRDMLDAIDSVCLEIQKRTLAVPEKVFCVLSTPWSHGEVRKIKHADKKEFRFSEKLAQKLILAETQNFKKTWSGLQDLLDRKITRIALNGYPTENPHGKKARNFEIDVYMSLADKELVGKIEEKIHKTFKARLAFTSQMFADFVVVRDAFELANDFIILNLGEEVTEVSILKDDYLVGTAFFPSGRAGIMRFVAKEISMSMHETKSLFSLHLGGLLDEKVNERFISAVAAAGRVWTEELKKVLFGLVPNRHLPHNIFLISDQKTENWLATYLGREFFPEFTTSHADFSVIMRAGEMLDVFAEFAIGAGGDAQLTRKSIFINHV